MGLCFEWDRPKAASNLRKHRVSFDEASTVFRDPLARIFDDEDHSEAEARETIVGYSALGRLLLAAFTERSPGSVRLISARRTTQQEREDYEEKSHN